MEMCKIKLLLKSTSPILFSRYHNVEHLEGEEPDKYEMRTWKDRAHTNEEGSIIIPGYMFQKTLEEGGKLTGERVGGKKMGKSLHQHLASIRVIGDIDTGIAKDDVQGHPAFVSSNGKPGGGKIMRIFPKIDHWRGILTFTYPKLGVLNEEIIMKYLDMAGACIGVGHWRPGSPSRGSYGTFIVRKPKLKTE